MRHVVVAISCLLAQCWGAVAFLCALAKRQMVWSLLCLLLASGCSSGMFKRPCPPGGYPNPIQIPPCDRDLAWDHLVNIVDDYFEIEREDRVRLVGDVLTVGRIDTFPLVGATLLEPWSRDAANLYERTEGTLQTIRRRAVVQVVPNQAGYLVEVAVFKELEDLAQPENASTGVATLRYDTSSNMQHFGTLVGAQAISLGWIPQGRDYALEQKILGDIYYHYVLKAPTGWRRIFYRAPAPPQ